MHRGAARVVQDAPCLLPRTALGSSCGQPLLLRLPGHCALLCSQHKSAADKHTQHTTHTLTLTHTALHLRRYVPYVGDSKRALDEYTSEIFLGGRNTIVLHNTCEDSLLAAPIILDLVLFGELLTRLELRRDGEPAFHGLHPVAVLLSYLTKAPLVPQGTPVVNALGRQRAMLENVMRACVGLPPENNMMMEFKA